MERRESPAPGGAWVAADRSLRQARREALRRHPVLWLLRRVRRRRGVSVTVDPPTTSSDILERVVALPLSVWTYGFDDSTVRHLGPMAQDFAAAFGLGDSDRRIDLGDANGVSLAAVQALHERLVALEARVARLEAQPSAEPREETVP